MAGNHFTVDILTPDKVVAKDVPAESLLIPTVRGQINVLAEHTHIVTKLGTGPLAVFGGAQDDDRHFTVNLGVCKVLKDKVVILANYSEETHEISVETAKEDLAHAERQLSSETLSDEEIELFRNKVEMAKLQIQMAEKYKS